MGVMMQAPARAPAGPTVADGFNGYPELGPLCRVWGLLDEADVSLGSPPGTSRGRWGAFVAVLQAAHCGFEPVIGWRNAAGITGNSVRTLRMAELRGLRIPAYRETGRLHRGPLPTAVFPLCQLIRWSEIHLGWTKREGW